MGPMRDAPGGAGAPPHARGGWCREVTDRRRLPYVLLLAVSVLFVFVLYPAVPTPHRHRRDSYASGYVQEEWANDGPDDAHRNGHNDGGGGGGGGHDPAPYGSNSPHAPTTAAPLHYDQDTYNIDLPFPPHAANILGNTAPRDMYTTCEAQEEPFGVDDIPYVEGGPDPAELRRFHNETNWLFPKHWRSWPKDKTCYRPVDHGDGTVNEVRFSYGTWYSVMNLCLHSQGGIASFVENGFRVDPGDPLKRDLSFPIDFRPEGPSCVLGGTVFIMPMSPSKESMANFGAVLYTAMSILQLQMRSDAKDIVVAFALNPNSRHDDWQSRKEEIDKWAQYLRQNEYPSLLDVFAPHWFVSLLFTIDENNLDHFGIDPHGAVCFQKGFLGYAPGPLAGKRNDAQVRAFLAGRTKMLACSGVDEAVRPRPANGKDVTISCLSPQLTKHLQRIAPNAAVQYVNATALTPKEKAAAMFGTDLLVAPYPSGDAHWLWLMRPHTVVLQVARALDAGFCTVHPGLNTNGECDAGGTAAMVRVDHLMVLGDAIVGGDALRDGVLEALCLLRHRGDEAKRAQCGSSS